MNPEKFMKLHWLVKLNILSLFFYFITTIVSRDGFMLWMFGGMLQAGILFAGWAILGIVYVVMPKDKGKWIGELSSACGKSFVLLLLIGTPACLVTGTIFGR